MFLDKQGAFAMQFSNNMRMEAYDASTGQTVMWPPDSSANVPTHTEQATTEFGDSIPEGLTISVMALMSAVAVVVSTVTSASQKPKLKPREGKHESHTMTLPLFFIERILCLF